VVASIRVATQPPVQDTRRVVQAKTVAGISPTLCPANAGSLLRRQGALMAAPEW